VKAKELNMQDVLKQRPLLTFAIVAYNQELYIREAIEAAFAQTYEPLQIILSDDCSPDRTFEIMQEMAAAYTGPHKLVLNRNESNLGVCGHVNRVCEMARGEWLVAAAGDDISLPERVEVLAECIRRHPAAAYATSQAKTFSDDAPTLDEGGNIISQALGATEAFRLSVFREFGPLRTDTFSEDWALYFRAQLKGEAIFVEQPLVRYRVSNTSLTSSFAKGGLSGKLRIHHANLRQFQADLDKMSPLSPTIEYLAREVATRLGCCKLLLQRLTSRRVSMKKAANIVNTDNIPWRVKLGLLSLLFTPCVYPCSERLRRSRLRVFSPTYQGLTYLNPQSLLKSAISCHVN